jgi:uncharacterized protein YjbI with pentapeptide repeats
LPRRPVENLAFWESVDPVAGSGPLREDATWLRLSLERRFMKLYETKERLEVQKSDLSGSLFSDVNVSGSSFENVNCSGANFDDANMSGWRVQNAA